MEDSLVADRLQPTIEPIERSSLVDTVRDRVVAMIHGGVLRSEDRIVESHLARDLGVSRSPVREALRQLEQQGLVVSSVGRGYAVPLLGEADIRELTQIRIALERAAVGPLIDEGFDEAAETELRALVAEMELAAGGAEPDLPRCTVLDSRFHETLCRLSGNKRLLAMHASLAGQISIALASINRSFPGTAHFADRHRELVNTFATGDARAAQDAVEAHILTGLAQYFG